MNPTRSMEYLFIMLVSRENKINKTQCSKRVYLLVEKERKKWGKGKRKKKNKEKRKVGKKYGRGKERENDKQGGMF